jgi:energy-converting hydrogenase Eha subunit B
MAEMLLINPRRRKAHKKATTHKRRVKAKTSVKRRRNPIAAARKHVMKHVRRRRNPIGGSKMNANTMMSAIKEALMGGVGAVAMDIVYGQINNMLPASLQRTPGVVGTGDAVKAVITVALGQVLNKATKGYSKRAAMASLTIQAHDIVKSYVPASMSLGYASPARVVRGTNRVGPISKTLSAYTTGTPMLNAYNKSGAPSPLLSGARSREGVTIY